MAFFSRELAYEFLWKISAVFILAALVFSEPRFAEMEPEEIPHRAVTAVSSDLTPTSATLTVGIREAGMRILDEAYSTLFVVAVCTEERVTRDEFFHYDVPWRHTIWKPVGAEVDGGEALLLTTITLRGDAIHVSRAVNLNLNVTTSFSIWYHDSCGEDLPVSHTRVQYTHTNDASARRATTQQNKYCVLDHLCEAERYEQFKKNEQTRIDAICSEPDRTLFKQKVV